MNDNTEPEARVFEPKIRRKEDDQSGGGLAAPLTRAVPEPVSGKSPKSADKELRKQVDG